jgi:hypothetical protein
MRISRKKLKKFGLILLLIIIFGIVKVAGRVGVQTYNRSNDTTKNLESANSTITVSEKDIIELKNMKYTV